MFGFFLLREPFIAIVLDARWQPVDDILLWLIPVGLLQSIGATVGGLYYVTGRTNVMFKWGVGSGLFVVPILAIGINWGITGVAAAYCIASFIIFYPGLAIPYRLVGLEVKKVLLELAPPVTTAAAMALIIAIVNRIWPANTDNQMRCLIMLTLVGIVSYFCISLITQKKLLKDMYNAICTR